MSTDLERFLAASPQPQRSGLRLGLALARRPRGAWLLKKLAPADQLINNLRAMDHFEVPQVSVPLGWDPDAVVAKGHALRTSERRP